MGVIATTSVSTEENRGAPRLAVFETWAAGSSHRSEREFAPFADCRKTRGSYQGMAFVMPKVRNQSELKSET